MRWHTGKPSIEGRTTLCLVHRSFKEEPKDDDIQEQYTLAVWNKSKQLFFHQENQSLFIEPDEIKRWAYVEEDDDYLDEELILTAISAAVSHVDDLYQILLTDGINCGEEYRDKIGLNELKILKNKLSKRILELDDMIGKDEGINQ